MKKIYVFIPVIILSSLLQAQGFEDSYVEWALPSGGYITNDGEDLGYYDINSTAYELNSESWDFLDMNGDLKPDLVVIGEGDGDWPGDFGTPSDPYWKVYFSEGEGFATAYTKWELPAGGTITYTGVHLGFYRLQQVADPTDGSQGWIVMDMNADKKPDLVVTSEGDGNFAHDFGTTAAPYWKVYLNEGESFADTYITWDLPSEGAVTNTGVLLGYNSFYHGPDYTDESESWGVADINGDSKPDLIVTAEGNGEYAYDLGTASLHYWKVYLNNGAGFDTDHIQWTTPDGGNTTPDGTFIGFNHLAANGSFFENDQSWTIMDMDGDQQPDLVVTGEGDGDYLYDFGTGSSTYWKVFKNLGNAFDEDPITWDTPTGGTYAYDGEFLGFYSTVGLSSYIDNTNGYSTLDINGDKLPDLIVTSEGDGDYALDFGSGTATYWKIYFNEGDQFADTYTEWATPIGGSKDYDGTQLGFVNTTTSPSYFLNCEYYITRDVDGDKMPDLLIPGMGNGEWSSGFGSGSGKYWKVYLNTTPDIIKTDIETTEIQFSIYPNPTTGYVQITTEPIHAQTDFKIFNTMGICLATGQITTGITEIDLSDYPAGSYLIQINSENQIIIKL